MYPRGMRGGWIHEAYRGIHETHFEVLRNKWVPSAEIMLRDFSVLEKMYMKIIESPFERVIRDALTLRPEGKWIEI